MISSSVDAAGHTPPCLHPSGNPVLIRRPAPARYARRAGAADDPRTHPANPTLDPDRAACSPAPLLPHFRELTIVPHSKRRDLTRSS